ncbi:MAG: DUF4397 domain-containing protein [Bacteroidota bacterium]
MKKFVNLIVAGLMSMMFVQNVSAQMLANVQIIHNSPDVTLDTVDVYIAGMLTFDDLAFREAREFSMVPAGVPVPVGFAPKTSTSIADVIESTTLPALTAGQEYILVAQGVRDPSLYNTPNADIDFKVEILNPAQSTGSSMMAVDVAVLHGSPDAPAVDVFAGNIGTGDALLNDVPYGAWTQGYLSLDPAEYILQVAGGSPMDSTTALASFHRDLSGDGGAAVLVFASGFLDPSMQPAGAEGFGLWVAFADGKTEPLTAIGQSDVQVIHNCADPAAAVVDIYVDVVNDTILLPDVAFRKAVGFTQLPAGYELEITIAPGTSTGIGDGLVTIPVTLMDGENYYAIASGAGGSILGTSGFTANPDMENIDFSLELEAGARTTAADPANVDLGVWHGATDAPTVDVLANENAMMPIVDDIKYNEFQGYLELAPNNYRLNITPGNNNSNILATYAADVTMLAGRAGIILASGFFTNLSDPMANNGGEAFGLLLILDNGDDIFLPTTTVSIDDQIETRGGLYGVYPNPVQDQATFAYRLARNEAVTLEVRDLSGRTILARNLGEQVMGDHTFTTDVSELAGGVYSFVLRTPSVQSVRKIVVTK